MKKKAKPKTLRQLLEGLTRLVHSKSASGNEDLLKVWEALQLLGKEREATAAARLEGRTEFERLVATNKMLAFNVDRLLKEKETLMRMVGRMTIERVVAKQGTPPTLTEEEVPRANPCHPLCSSQSAPPGPRCPPCDCGRNPT